MIQAHFLHRLLRIFRSSSVLNIFSHSGDPSWEIAVRRQTFDWLVTGPHIFSPLTIIVGRTRAGALNPTPYLLVALGYFQVLAVQSLAELRPCDYIIPELATGERVSITPGRKPA